MPYAKDENRNHILDENSNKVEYTVSYPKYTNIHENDDGHLDTENRHLVMKDGVDADPAVLKGQMINQIATTETLLTNLINTTKDTTTTQTTSQINTINSQTTNQIKTLKNTITTQIQTSIKTALDALKVELQKQIIQFRNEQIRGRIGRKALGIPKTNYIWIPLLSASDIDGATTLQDVVVQNVYIRRNDRYHHAKSDLVASRFEQLEFFFSSDFTKYYCYFNTHPSGWGMECFLEYIVIPRELPVSSDEE